MKLANSNGGESKLETTISSLLVGGVVMSLFLEIIGMASFYYSYGHLHITERKAMVHSWREFFPSHIRAVGRKLWTRRRPLLDDPRPNNFDIDSLCESNSIGPLFCVEEEHKICADSHGCLNRTNDEFTLALAFHFALETGNRQIERN